MQDSAANSLVNQETKEIMVKLVTSLLTARPTDPVPHIYSYLQEIQKGVPPNEIMPITENEINELRNLEKKVAYLREKLGDTGSQTESENSEDDEVEELQPKKKNINKQRQGVSAEAYGKFNQKGDFKPKVVAKSAETTNKLRARLL